MQFSDIALHLLLFVYCINSKYILFNWKFEICSSVADGVDQVIVKEAVTTIDKNRVKFIGLTVSNTNICCRNRKKNTRKYDHKMSLAKNGMKLTWKNKNDDDGYYL